MASSHQTSAKRVAQLGLLFALAMALSYVEWLIPPAPGLPPGIKLGLSNIVTMYTLYCLHLREALLLLLVKALFTFLVRGFTGALLSLCGGLCSVWVMFLLLSMGGKRLSVVLISAFGGMAHNLGQLLGAMLLLRMSVLWIYLPILLLAGILMGCITGILWRTVQNHRSF